MALKYPGLDCLVVVMESWVRSLLALREALQNSLRRELRRGVHQGLNLREGPEWGVETSIVGVRMERAEENQRSSCLGEGDIGGGRTSAKIIVGAWWAQCVWRI